ncbi:MAG: DUF4405 domain-containing protein [Lachnospiraceae bacterium]
MKKNWSKLILDLIMLVIFLLLFNKRVLGMSFHEIAGLCVGAVVIVHLLLNGKWVTQITGKLMDSKLPPRTRILYLLNVLLLITAGMVIFSGAMISKVVFSFNLPGPWKIIHYFCSAMTIVLMGIHLGLHAKYLQGMGKKLIRKREIPRLLSFLLCVGICAFGVYQLSTGSFSRWLTMPFTLQEMNFAASISERQSSDSLEGKGGSDSMKEKEFTESMKEKKFSGSMKGREIPDSMNQERKSPSSGISNVLSTLGSFFSQIFVFATITVLTEKWINKSRNTKKIAPSPTPTDS